MNFFQRLQAMMQRGNAVLVPYVQRCTLGALRFFFIVAPVWIWKNTFVAGFNQVLRWVTGQLRRYALLIILASIVLALVATEQYQLLDILLRFSIAIAFLIVGFGIMFRGVFPKKKKK